MTGVSGVSGVTGERRPRLIELAVGDAPERWTALGFSVLGGAVCLDGVRIALGKPGRGITGWSLSGVEPVSEIDGLPTSVLAAPGGVPAPVHPNGALALDHVVVVTPDFERTRAALEAAGMPFRRVRNVDPGGFRQGFRRLGPAILEVVEARDAPPGPARFWGLVVTVGDLPGLVQRLGEHAGRLRAAVQPGRQIAPVRASAGLGPALAFMDPEPGPAPAAA